MKKLSILVLATAFLAGCGGGSMPFVPPHNAGDVADGRQSANSLPLEHVTTVSGPSSFTFGGYTWQTHAWNAPPVGNKNGNVGTFVKANVSIGSELVLTLKQTRSGSTILSSGAEVGTTRNFQYGTFQFTSRVVNVASGSVASGFLYATNSITEIDMEQVGTKRAPWTAPTGRDYRISRIPKSPATTRAIPTISRSSGVPVTLIGRWTENLWCTTPVRCRAPRRPSCSISGGPTPQAGEAQPHRNHPLHVYQQLQVHTVGIGRQAVA
jgi:hypothetical protein